METNLTKQIYDSLTYIDDHGFPCDYMVDETPKENKEDGPWVTWLNAFNKDEKLTVEMDGAEYTVHYKGDPVYIGNSESCSLIVPGKWVDAIEEAHRDAYVLSLGYHEKTANHLIEVNNLCRSLGLEEPFPA